MRTLAVGFALVLIAAPVSAQNAADDHWTSWLGCWELVLENAREGAPTAEPVDELPRARDTVRPRVCVERAPDGGATFRTTIGNATPILQTVVADGTNRPITDRECTGTQRSEWSRNGLRLYTRAELNCKNDPAPRRVSGFAMLGPNATWTDVQAIDVGGRESYRVRRYRLVDPAPDGQTRRPGLALSIADVKEASGKVAPEALEAALLETSASFLLSSRQLIELADANVSPNLIDLMVALSYPNRFVVERSERAEYARLGPGFPIWSDGFGFYSLYDPFSSYYYSPWSYGYRGYGPSYGFGGGGIYITDDGGGVIGQDRPSGLGRVVDGQGYTRVRPRDSEPGSPRQGGVGTFTGSAAASSGSGSSTVTSQGFTSGASSSSSSGDSSSSGSSGGGSSSSSGSSDGGGRTAQPR